MRLATFNILHGRSLTDGQVDLARFAAAVRTLDVDILALQEVDRRQPRSHQADLTEIAAGAMGAVSHRFAAAISGTPGAAWTAANGRDVRDTPSYEIALLSRYPATSWRVVQLPRIPVRLPMWRPECRRVVLVDEEPRVAVVGSFDTPAGPVTVANSHVSFIPRWNRRQLRTIVKSLQGIDEPTVLMGDLNMPAPLPPATRAFRSLAAGLTFPADVPGRQLDHILLRGDLGTVTSAGTRLLPLSDHRALVVELHL